MAGKTEEMVLLTDDPMEEGLRKLRGYLAYSHKVQPFQVFNNKVLVELLKRKPKYKVEFKGIKGFPENGKAMELFSDPIAKYFRGEWKQPSMDIF